MTKRNHLLEVIKWAKNQTYTGANEALEHYNELTGLKLFFQEHVSAYGTYYEVEFDNTPSTETKAERTLCQGD